MHLKTVGFSSMHLNDRDAALEDCGNKSTIYKSDSHLESKSSPRPSTSQRWSRKRPHCDEPNRYHGSRCQNCQRTMAWTTHCQFKSARKELAPMQLSAYGAPEKEKQKASMTEEHIQSLPLTRLPFEIRLGTLSV